jgi:spoIIIJ-associated protein
MTENLVTNGVAKDSPGPDVAGADRAPSVADQLNNSAVASVRALEEPAPPDQAPEDEGFPDVDDAAEAENGSHAGNGRAAADGTAPPGRGGADGDDGADGGDPVNGHDPNAAAPREQQTDELVSGQSSGTRRAPSHEQLVAEGDAAGDYLERLLDILDFDGDIDLDVEGERAAVSIIGDSTDIDKLVGERGEVLDALQELTRLAATAETGQRSRLMLDIGGYRAKRRTELSALGTLTARDVLNSGQPVRLAPMNPFERKVVHDAVAEVDGVSSSSEGEEPRRRVVVSPETSTA